MCSASTLLEHLYIQFERLVAVGVMGNICPLYQVKVLQIYQMNPQLFFLKFNSKTKEKQHCVVYMYNQPLVTETKKYSYGFIRP